MASGPAPVELSADCMTCGLEAGLVEIYDSLVPACRFGLPASSKCKLCGVRHASQFTPTPSRPMRDIPANRCPACLEELGPRTLDERRCAKCGATATLELVEPGELLNDEVSLAAALDAWAKRERWPSREALAEAVFCDPSLPSLVARIRNGEPLEVVADPFANMGLRTTGRPTDPPARPTPPPIRASTPAMGVGAVVPTPPETPVIRYFPTPPAGTVVPVEMIAPASRPSAPPPASAPPRAIVYPLVSVIAADGEIHPAERALVDRFLESEGLAPLTEDEFRVHEPAAVAHLVPKERREAVVQLMCETATVDGMPDESERRVIRAYATAWNVPDEKVEFWMWGYESMGTGFVRQLWMKLRRFVLSARWSDSGQETR